jgi:hypothetical protein
VRAVADTNVYISALNFGEFVVATGHHLDTSAPKQKGPQETEGCKLLSLCGAEAGTRTPMGIRSLRPESGGWLREHCAMVGFCEVRSMAGFAGMVQSE